MVSSWLAWVLVKKSLFFYCFFSQTKAQKWTETQQKASTDALRWVWYCKRECSVSRMFGKEEINDRNVNWCKWQRTTKNIRTGLSFQTRDKVKSRVRQNNRIWVNRFQIIKFFDRPWWGKNCFSRRITWYSSLSWCKVDELLSLEKLVFLVESTIFFIILFGIPNAKCSYFTSYTMLFNLVKLNWKAGLTLALKKGKKTCYFSVQWDSVY